MSATYVPTENENPLDMTRLMHVLQVIAMPGWIDKANYAMRVVMAATPAVSQSGTWNVGTVTNVGTYHGDMQTFAQQRAAWMLHVRNLIT